MKLDLWCEIFLDTNVEVLDLILLLLPNWIKKYHWKVETDLLSIYITKNDEYNEKLKDNSSEWFLYFKYYLEIEPINENLDKEKYIEEIWKLLEWFWKNGCKAVAVCDFDYKLPKNWWYKNWRIVE